MVYSIGGFSFEPAEPIGIAPVIICDMPGVEVVSVITTNSVDRLNLTVGKEVVVVIKSTSVMIDA
jgi:molybdopterin-binding protein